MVMKKVFDCKLLLIVFALVVSSCQPRKEASMEKMPKNDISAFLGQWSFDIGKNQVGWLEVRQENGYVDADLLWGGGSILPVSYVFMSNGKLTVGRGVSKEVRTKDETGNEKRVHLFPQWVEFTVHGETISGYSLRPAASGIGLDSTAIGGKKLPGVPPAPDLAKITFGESIRLLAENDLSGWKLVEEDRTNGWSVKDGILVNDPIQKEGAKHINYGNIRTEKEFQDFNIKLEVNVPAHSNSGVYLCGRYEIQVSDSYGLPLDSHNMGALYSRIVPSVNAEKPAGEWQSLDITICDRHLTVLLNGIKIIDNQPVYGPTGGALTSDIFTPGPLYLQGDHGKVSYRNIVITPIIKK
jgi:hypothetical protein